MEGVSASPEVEGMGEDSHTPGLPCGGEGHGSPRTGQAFVSCANVPVIAVQWGAISLWSPKQSEAPSTPCQRGPFPQQLSGAVLTGHRSRTTTALRPSDSDINASGTFCRSRKMRPRTSVEVFSLKSPRRLRAFAFTMFTYGTSS